jgi:apolipoprotein N-acyltransferase
VKALKPLRALALPRGDWLLVLSGGVLVALAYPPYHFFFPTFICLIPAIRLIVDGMDDPRPLRRHLVQGFWFGLLANGLVLYWIVSALWHFTPLALLGYAASITILALYAAGVFALTGWVTRRTGVGLVLTFPVFWLVADWAIGHQADIRFPWLGLGTSLTAFPTIVQIADVIGARGITFLLAVANAALAMAWVGWNRDRRRAVRGVATVVVGLLLATLYGVMRERTLETRSLGVVSLLQPNIPYQEKWEGSGANVFQRTLDLAYEAARPQPILIAWPEVAAPGYLLQPRWSSWREGITLLGRTGHIPQIVGALHAIDVGEPTEERYNAAFFFDALGLVDTGRVYLKQYLVPMTERVPFLNPSWFNIRFFGGFGSGHERPVYDVGAGRFGVLICFESAFEDLSRAYRRSGADFVVNITNDMWFGRSAGPHQHAAHLVMRAIENRVGIARAANTGISEFIDPFGRVYSATELETEVVATDEVLTTDGLPLYVRLGDWVSLLCLATGAGLVAFALARRQ